MSLISSPVVRLAPSEANDITLFFMIFESSLSSSLIKFYPLSIM